MKIAYLNGNYLPLDQAQVSVLDRGFIFGDGVYEVIPVYNGHLFRLAQHLRRLEHSLKAIYLKSPIKPEEWPIILNELIKRNGGGDQSIYLQITRGAAPARDLTLPTECHPTCFAFSQPLASRSLDDLMKGATAITLEDTRWRHCDVKAVALLANVLLRRQTTQAKVDEGILIRDGYAMEGVSSNLFVVRAGTIFTAPTSPLILGGITRELILELARKHNIPCQEVAVPITELAQADEIWLTSSSKEVMPVLKLNDQLINDGKIGPLWHKMIQYFHAFKKAQ